MIEKLARCYLSSAGVILFVTGVAKLASSGGSARALQTIDPIIGLPFGTLFFVVGVLELVNSHYILKWAEVLPRAMLVAWISTCFLVYRIGLVWVGWHKPCGCLGTFTEALHMSPQTADTIMKFVLGYLLAGSYACLLACWRKGAGAGHALGGPEAATQAQNGGAA
jgi:hypothetical protein